MKLVCSVWVSTKFSKMNKISMFACFWGICGCQNDVKSPHKPNLTLFDRFLFIWPQQHCRRDDYLNGNELRHGRTAVPWATIRKFVKKGIKQAIITLSECNSAEKGSYNVLIKSISTFHVYTSFTA